MNARQLAYRDIADAVSAGNRIKAVKHLRSHAGIGLHPAIDAIDAILDGRRTVDSVVNEFFPGPTDLIDALTDAVKALRRAEAIGSLGMAGITADVLDVLARELLKNHLGA